MKRVTLERKDRSAALSSRGRPGSACRVKGTSSVSTLHLPDNDDPLCYLFEVQQKLNRGGFVRLEGKTA